MSKKTSIDTMAEQFASPEEQKAYSDAQYKTILSLNEKLNAAQKMIEELRAENASLKVKDAIESSKSDSPFKVTDEETICVTQLSILKSSAMSRELTMDEVKRVEILTKVLLMIRGKVDAPKKGEDASKMSNEELMKWVEESTKEKQ